VPSSDVSAPPGSCAVHTERPAVETCRSCGRAVCLACAIPFRGEVLCTTCAARELGDEALRPPPPERLRRPLPVAAALFAVGTLATLPPWDRFGGDTAILSAWSPQPEPWTSAASLSLLLAAVVAAVARLLPVRVASGASALLGGAAALAAVLTIFGSPDFVRHTPAPYVALAAAALGAGLALLRFRRAGRWPPR
jgi:hypothetical protein